MYTACTHAKSGKILIQEKLNFEYEKINLPNTQPKPAVDDWLIS